MPLNNSQYNAIMRAYDQIRFSRQSEQRARIAQIYQNYPDLQSIDEKIQSASADAARARILDPAGAKEKVDTVNALRKERRQRIKLHGLSEKDFEVQHDCPDCLDTGYIKVNQKCHCMKQKEIDLLYTQSNLKRVLETENFRNFNINLYRKDTFIREVGCDEQTWMKEVYDVCVDYARNFGTKGPQNMLFSGDTGVGKSFMTHCIADAVLKRGFSVMAITAIELFDTLQNRNRFEDDDEPDDSNYLLDCDLLIIDDLGSENVTASRISQLFYCLNARLQSGRATIISTNLALSQIRDLYTERISSRISAYFSFHPMFGRDIRFILRRD